MIIAEIGSIHDGSFGNAKKIIKLASECGANAVKFQTHISSAETIKDALLQNILMRSQGLNISIGLALKLQNGVN